MKLGLSPTQIAARRQGIGGSDAASIVAGGEEWVRLWKIKTGRAEPEDLSGVLRVQMGNATEEFNAFWYTKQTGREVILRGEFVRHRTIPYLFANLDGMTTTRQGAPAYIDFKHVGKGGEATEIRYVAQCTHAALVLASSRREAVDWWCLSTFVGNSKWELLEAEVDPFFAADYLEKCSEFWGYVERDEEPPMPAPVPVPRPRLLRIVQLEDEFRDTWPNWAGDMLHQFGIFADTDAAAKRNAIARDEIKRLLPEDVGTVTRGRVKVHRDTAGAVRTTLLKEKK